MDREGLQGQHTDEHLARLQKSRAKTVLEIGFVISMFSLPNLSPFLLIFPVMSGLVYTLGYYNERKWWKEMEEAGFRNMDKTLEFTRNRIDRSTNRKMYYKAVDEALHEQHKNQIKKMTGIE